MQKHIFQTDITKREPQIMKDECWKPQKLGGWRQIKFNSKNLMKQTLMSVWVYVCFFPFNLANVSLAALSSTHSIWNVTWSYENAMDFSPRAIIQAYTFDAYNWTQSYYIYIWVWIRNSRLNSFIACHKMCIMEQPYTKII